MGDHWLDEGGHDGPPPTRAHLLAEISAADESQLAALWQEAVAAFGSDEASHLWWEALSASDATDT
jgi:hypothetical protein